MNTAKILVVDDEELFRKLTQKTLERCGYIVETAVDGADAWDMINDGQYDLILLDKQMPKLDGISLLRLIKADNRFMDIPVVMLTANNRQEDVIEGLAAGAYYYLTKPAAGDLLRLVIGNVLAEFRQKRELRQLIGQQINYQKLLRRAEFSYQTLSEAKNLALLLAEISMNPARTLNGYMELLINAVEHGNLGISYAEKSRLLKDGCWEEEIDARLTRSQYASRRVQVKLDKTDTHCTLTVIDEGNGFDWSKFLEFSSERAFDLHGRGIAMSKAISFDSLEYQGNGNTVVAKVIIAAESFGT